MKRVSAFQHIGGEQMFLRRSIGKEDAAFCEDFPEFMVELSETIQENLADLQRMLSFYNDCKKQSEFDVEYLNDRGECLKVCCAKGRAVAQRQLDVANHQATLKL
jgi:hypothetical protein